jgi:hypothetical protein
MAENTHVKTACTFSGLGLDLNATNNPTLKPVFPSLASSATFSTLLGKFLQHRRGFQQFRWAPRSASDIKVPKDGESRREK